ncbi:MAG: hypothetical protein L6R36_008893 [Xanthoria steineri]|nr:MAG: hypothetical protein L6R36_008893 [Xanthoria steineri]
MSDTADSSETRTTPDSRLDTLVKAPLSSIFQAASETLDLRFLLLQTLVHPLNALQSNLSHLLPLTMFGFGGKKFRPDEDIGDLSGKVVVITGGEWFRLDTCVLSADKMTGNNGLGKESVLQLAKHNPARILLAARTPSKAEAAIKEIKTAVPSANISYLKLDLCSFKSISAAAQDFQSQSPRLDILMNNAGIMATPLAETEDGYESQFGTNHMGHALFTKLLMPILLKTAEEEGSDVRIVNLTSEGHNLAPRPQGILLDEAKLKAQGPWARYGQSKLANILFTKELASRYPSITSVAIHPGIISTGLYGPNQQSNMLLRYGVMLIGPLIMADVRTGALNQLWGAAGKKTEVMSGNYYTPVGACSKGSKWAQKKDLAEELWAWTEQELASKGYS